MNYGLFCSIKRPTAAAPEETIGFIFLKPASDPLDTEEASYLVLACSPTLLYKRIRPALISVTGVYLLFSQVHDRRASSIPYFYLRWYEETSRVD
jgi:hypothetical protein